ncbi:MAG: hypothetical protein DRJ50_06795 [Actinobacteria bacterium]|nr:MAG: hypothetical protein DRJ50_06795 [Actinomycetota bacterium]
MAPELLDEPVPADPIDDDPEISGQIVPALRVVAPTPIIPAMGTIGPGPADVSGGSEAAGMSTDVLPEIQEATPAPGTPAIVQAATSQVHQSDAGPASPPAEYQLPRVPQPDQAQGRPTPAQSPLAVSYAQPVKQDTRPRSGRGIMLLFTLLVLGGLVAAGIVFGRPYLFPENFDESTDPHAGTVQDVTDTEFADPVVVTAEPTPDYTARLIGELTGEWQPQQAQWRALGLLNGPNPEEVVSDLLAGWQDALYSTEDGQVYHDVKAQGNSLDAELTLAMAGAVLDQEFGWSVGEESRTLDNAALVSAEVLRQSREIQQASEFPKEIDVRDATPLVFLPPVLGYEVLAPVTFAEFGPFSEGEPNPLSQLGEGGTGPTSSGVVVGSAAPIVVEGDQVFGAPVGMDSSFWYLVFAGFLENTTAAAASNAIVESSLVTADRAGTECVYATFSGGDVTQTATLRAAIESWSANVPAEFGSSTAVLPDGTLQFVSCDPGEGFDSQSRLGTARELVGWRIAELATFEAVTDSGGTSADFAVAMGQVNAAGVAAELAVLPLDITPAEAADAAREAVAGVLQNSGE